MMIFRKSFLKTFKKERTFFVKICCSLEKERTMDEQNESFREIKKKHFLKTNEKTRQKPILNRSNELGKKYRFLLPPQGLANLILP